jgi:magnesium-transporting ATPase (P-type)
MTNRPAAVNRVDPTAQDRVVDAMEPVERLLRDLRTSRRGLSSREVERRLIVYGPNELRRRGGNRRWRELARQFTHPLALLLWAAAGLAWLASTVPVAIAIVVIIVLNAIFAFFQEVQAERAVEALQGYLPQRARVLRDGTELSIEAAQLVPGDILLIDEGERISADARLLVGTLEVDSSTLSGESMPVARSAAWTDVNVPLLQARDLVFSGTSCTGGEATAVVFATGMRTELGRIAALSELVRTEESPLEHQVRRVAWLIAIIAVLMAIAFMPIATLGAGLSLSNALVFAVGLITGNVPEGLLPVITLALAIGVRGLARRGAVMKRLSAVETLGSTDVICTDKTGTLTENRMRVTRLWTTAGERIILAKKREDASWAGRPVSTMCTVMSLCSNAAVSAAATSGDPTEVALLEAALLLGEQPDAEERLRMRKRHFHFDPALKLMSTVDEQGGAGDPGLPGQRPQGGIPPSEQGGAGDPGLPGQRALGGIPPSEQAGRLWVHTKGAPEAVLPLCSSIIGADGADLALDSDLREGLMHQVDAYAASGLRVLAFAVRELEAGEPPPDHREEAERGLSFVGLAAMLDPPRPEVADAVARCHRAGIRVIVVTGDHPLTAMAIAEQVGIVASSDHVITGERLDRMADSELDSLLRGKGELIFARASPEAKLRIAESLRAEGHVVAMTGDGVNDAPALRRADVGVAMGRSGTDVAREAATMVLTDDNFATIVSAVEAGRRVYDNIRKFILYIFAHATPEVVPFLVFAFGRGAIPLPLTVLQLLVFDVGTETLPALALGREPAEAGLMSRPPRLRNEGVIQRAMLLRAWLFLGLIAAALQMGAFFSVLIGAGWHPGAPVGSGSPLHHAYQQATTMTFLAMVVGQIGTAVAARTEHASLRSVGLFSNRLLLWGIGLELMLTAVIVYFPPIQQLLGTAALTPRMLLTVVPFPFVVWGADELRRYLVRRRSAGSREQSMGEREPPAGAAAGETADG